MIKLLRANFRRLFKDKLFYLVVGISAALALFVTVMFKLNAPPEGVAGYGFESIFIFMFGIGGMDFSHILAAAVICVYVGKEFGYGSIRNKIVVGGGRAQIFFSNFIVSAFIGTAIIAAYQLPAFAVGYPLTGGFENLSWGTAFAVLGTGILSVIAYAAYINLLLTITKSTTASVITAFISMIIFIIAENICYNMLNQPEFYYTLSDGAVNGEPVLTPNPYYPSEFAKLVYQFFLNLLPTGQSSQISIGVTNQLAYMCVCSVCLTTALCAFGYAIFRKTDLK